MFESSDPTVVSPTPLAAQPAPAAPPVTPPAQHSSQPIIISAQPVVSSAPSSVSVSPTPVAAPADSAPAPTPDQTPAPDQIPLAPADHVLVAPENRPQPEQLLLEWTAPNRPFKARNRKYYVTIAMILILISLILFFAGQLILIAVAIAAAFLFYVLSAIPPETVKNQITTFGIRTDNQLYTWEEMGRFWFKVKYQQQVLHVEVSRFPNHLTLLLGTQTEADITEILSQVLLQQEPLPTGFDKAAAWLQDKIQLDPEA